MFYYTRGEMICQAERPSLTPGPAPLTLPSPQGGEGFVSQ